MIKLFITFVIFISMISLVYATTPYNIALGDLNFTPSSVVYGNAKIYGGNAFLGPSSATQIVNRTASGTLIGNVLTMDNIGFRNFYGNGSTGWLIAGDTGGQFKEYNRAGTEITSIASGCAIYGAAYLSWNSSFVYTVTANSAGSCTESDVLRLDVHTGTVVNLGPKIETSSDADDLSIFNAEDVIFMSNNTHIVQYDLNWNLIDTYEMPFSFTDGERGFLSGNSTNIFLQYQAGKIVTFDISRTTPPGPTTGTYTLTAKDIITKSSLNNITLMVSNSSYSYNTSTQNGTIILINTTVPFNKEYILTFNSNQSGGYFEKNYTLTLEDSSSFIGNLTRLYSLDIQYSNYVNISTKNYTRNLTYSINLTCPDFSSSNLKRYINNTLNGTIPLTCTNTHQTISGYYIHALEGPYNIKFILGTDYRDNINNISTINKPYISDLYNPTVAYLNFSLLAGFGPAITNITLRCTDNIMPQLLYNLSLNDTLLHYTNETENTTYKNETILFNGVNGAYGSCSDYFGTEKNITILDVFANELILIDERTKDSFDINNVTGAKIYFDSNESVFDLKAAGANAINFTTTGEDKLRVELEYSDGTIITRYVDVRLINDEIRVCANKEGVDYYQQLIIAASEKEALLKNVFANCYIAADYTRFAYQDAYMLQASSISALYSLYTYDSGTQILLASLDGSIEAYINLDQLEFTQTAYNIALQTDMVSIEKTDTAEMTIYYKNLKEDNTALTATITRLDTDTIVYTDSTFADPNEFFMYFNYATLTNVTNSTLFQLDLEKTTVLSTSTLTKYFNTNASVGSLRSQIAAVIGTLLMFFGLTFAATRLTFSWFGAIIAIASIGILSFAIITSYIMVLIAIDIIILIYIILQLLVRNNQTIA